MKLSQQNCKILEEKYKTICRRACWGNTLNFVDAIQNGSLHEIERNLKHQGFEEDYLRLINTALILAANDNDLDTVSILAHSGANVDYQDGHALKRAIRMDRGEMIKLLLELGANPNICDNILNDVVDNVDYDLTIVKLLFEKGLQIEQQDSGRALITLLGYFTEFAEDHCFRIDLDCYKNIFDTVKYLLEKGADVQYCHNYPFKFAAKHANLELVKLFLSYGADPNKDYNICFGVNEEDRVEVDRYIKSWQNRVNRASSSSLKEQSEHEECSNSVNMDWEATLKTQLNPKEGLRVSLNSDNFTLSKNMSVNRRIVLNMLEKLDEQAKQQAQFQHLQEILEDSSISIRERLEKILEQIEEYASNED